MSNTGYKILSSKMNPIHLARECNFVPSVAHSEEEDPTSMYLKKFAQ